MKAIHPTAGAGGVKEAAFMNTETPAMPEADQTAIPTSETASIALNLPKKIASTGTAAASTSITLFDFSSTRFDSSIEARKMVNMNSNIWPKREVIDRWVAREPADSSTVTR